MKLLNLTLPTPEENLACDEALLNLCEQDGETEILRFWQSNHYAVVLGYANKIKEHVNLNNCQRDNIPVIRRASGGGTVLQGPGCFNFSLILQTHFRPELKSITSANCYIHKQNREALAPFLNQPLTIQGYTDLCIENKKCAGHAQRRGKRVLLFHGSFLLNMNLSIIGHYLPIPETQPEYRAGRSHLDFLQNLPIKEDTIYSSLALAWKAAEPFELLPEAAIKELVLGKYSQASWNNKF